MRENMPGKYKCRMSRFGSFLPDEFNRISCANCYSLLQYVFPGSEFPLNTTNDGYFQVNDDKLLDPQVKEDIDIIKTSMESLEFDKWRSCCDEAKKCCSQVMSKTFVERNKSFFNFGC
jgi:hypothetical protein